MPYHMIRRFQLPYQAFFLDIIVNHKVYARKTKSQNLEKAQDHSLKHPNSGLIEFGVVFILFYSYLKLPLAPFPKTLRPTLFVEKNFVVLKIGYPKSTTGSGKQRLCTSARISTDRYRKPNARSSLALDDKHIICRGRSERKDPSDTVANKNQNASLLKLSYLLFNRL